MSEHQDSATDQGRYNVVRYYYRDSRKRVILRAVSLAEAQEHCKSPETSSKTATGRGAVALTRRRGPWFDGYEACRR